MRAQLRAGLPGVSVEIAGEAATIEAARALNVVADAWLVAVDGRSAGDPAPGVRLQPHRLRPDSLQGDRVRASRRQTDRLQADEPVVAESLTPREIEVLDLLADGLSNKAIARRLGISDQTVKFHVSSLCGKLGASNRTGAVRRAVRRGLITL